MCYVRALYWLFTTRCKNEPVPTQEMPHPAEQNRPPVLTAQIHGRRQWYRIGCDSGAETSVIRACIRQSHCSSVYDGGIGKLVVQHLNPAHEKTAREIPDGRGCIGFFLGLHLLHLVEDVEEEPDALVHTVFRYPASICARSFLSLIVSSLANRIAMLSISERDSSPSKGRKGTGSSFLG